MIFDMQSFAAWLQFMQIWQETRYKPELLPSKFCGTYSGNCVKIVSPCYKFHHFVTWLNSVATFLGVKIDSKLCKLQQVLARFLVYLVKLQFRWKAKKQGSTL